MIFHVQVIVRLFHARGLLLSAPNVAYPYVLFELSERNTNRQERWTWGNFVEEPFCGTFLGKQKEKQKQEGKEKQKQKQTQKQKQKQKQNKSKNESNNNNNNNNNNETCDTTKKKEKKTGNLGGTSGSHCLRIS